MSVGDDIDFPIYNGLSLKDYIVIIVNKYVFIKDIVQDIKIALDISD
jgi:hypothetical protein